MIEIVLQCLFFPASVAIIIFLLPRSSWSVETGHRIDVWTAAPAMAAATLLSLYAVEGSEIWHLTQKWYSLWISAIILGFGGVVATVNFKQIEKPERAIGSEKTFVLACTAAIAIFVFKMPDNNNVLLRLLFGAIAGIATYLLSKPSGRAPVLIPLSFSFVLCMLSIKKSDDSWFCGGSPRGYSTCCCQYLKIVSLQICKSKIDAVHFMQ